MHHGFLYGVHSSETALSAHDVAQLHQLGHTAHLRIIGDSLKRHELHRELQVLHYLKHYGLVTIVDVSNSKDVQKNSQHLRELADVLLVAFGGHGLVIEHDEIDEDDVARAHRIRASLRAIEVAQARGEHIRGYFAGSYVPVVRHSDLVLQAIIRQAQQPFPSPVLGEG